MTEQETQQILEALRGLHDDYNAVHEQLIARIEKLEAAQR